MITFAAGSKYTSKLLWENLLPFSRLGRPGQAWNDQQREVGSGTWAQARWRKVTKPGSFLQRCLDICESYFKNVWYLAAILDALARLQKTISRNLICANSARSTPTKFFTARSLRQWLLYMHYLNFQPWKVKWADHISESRWLSRSMQRILFLKWWENKITGGYTCPPVPN